MLKKDRVFCFKHIIRYNRAIAWKIAKAENSGNTIIKKGYLSMQLKNYIAIKMAT